MNDWQPSYWRPDRPYSNQQHIRNLNPHHTSNNVINDEIRRTALQKYTPLKNTPQTSTYSKAQSPWISKLQNTVKSFKENIRNKVTKLFDTSSFPQTTLEKVSQESYNPNRQGIPVGISGINPIAAVFSSLITSLSITSLAFTRELVFGHTFVPGESNTSPATELTNTFRNPFMYAIVALCEVLSSGIRSLLNIKGGGCGIGGSSSPGEGTGNILYCCNLAEKK